MSIHKKPGSRQLLLPSIALLCVHGDDADIHSPLVMGSNPTREPEHRHEALPFAIDEQTPPEVVEAFLKGPEALEALLQERPDMERIITMARQLWAECLHM